MPEDTNGIVTLRSAHSFDETLRRLLELLKTKETKVFAIVDHSGEAERAGLRMPETKLVIFGNPMGGTPVMIAAPTAAIDLPLKLLIWKAEAGERNAEVLVSYNTVEFLSQRHGIDAELLPALKAVEVLARAITA